MAMAGGFGQMIFSMLFNFALMMLFAPKPKDTISYGPRLDNMKVSIKDIQDTVINLTYGTTRISGTVFWASDIRETVHTEKTEYNQGGKGGGSSYTNTNITYTYDCDLAIGLCEGPIVGIRKIWANKELLYDNSQVPAKVDWLKYKLYTGTETQSTDPLLEANIGYGRVTAHRGLAYIVFEKFQLDPFGRRLPQSFEVEVVAKGVKNGLCYKYPQVDYTLYKDRGCSSIGYTYSNGFFNCNKEHSIFKIQENNYVLPLTTDPNGFYVKLNVATSEINKFPLRWPQYCSCDFYSFGWHSWACTNLYGTNGSAYWGSGGTTYYIWLDLPMSAPNSDNTAVQYYYKSTPCLVLTCSRDYGNMNYHEAIFVVNLINNKCVLSSTYPNMISVGSFTWTYQSGIYDNSFNALTYHDGIGYAHSAEIKNTLRLPPPNSTTDEYGYYTGQHTKCYKYDSNNMTPNDVVTTWHYEQYGFYKDRVHFHLTGFPPFRETIDHCEDYWFEQVFSGKINSEDLTPDMYEYIDIFRDYDILDYSPNTSTEFQQIKYENVANNILDALDHSKFCLVKVKITTRTVKYYCNFSIKSDTTVSTSYWYPSSLGKTFGFYDKNPNPPEPGGDLNTTLTSKKTIFTYYMDDPNYNAVNKPSWGGYRHGPWIKFKDGSEFFSIEWNPGGTTYYATYRKGNFSEYSIPVFGSFEEYQNWYISQNPYDSDYFSIYFSYQEYTTLINSTEYRVISPNDWYYDINKKMDQSITITCPTGYTYDFDSPLTTPNKAPFVRVKSYGLNYNCYWEPGMSKIYYTYTGNCIYSWDLRTNETIQIVCCSKPLYNVVPYGNDFIGYTATGGTETGVYYITIAVDEQPALLGEIIEDISTKCKINLDNLDISDECYNTLVFGYNISDDTKLYDALETLLIHYFVDAYESEWKIKFRLRKEYLKTPSNIKIIQDEELGARYINDNYNEKYRITQREDTQLPESLSYSYISYENSFNIANVIAIRNINYNLGIKQTIKAPIAMYTNDAYNNAFRILFDIWRATREIEFRLPNNFAFLEPGDVVYLPINANKYSNEYIPVKIYEITAESNAYLEIKGVEEDARNLEGIITDGTYEPYVSVLDVPINTSAVPFETRPLYNKYNNITYSDPVLYYTVYANSERWKGATIGISYDGVTFPILQDVGNFLSPVGNVVTFTSYSIYSRYSEDVQSTITFDSISKEDFFATDENDFEYKEGNLVAIIDSFDSNNIEYIQFRNITEDPNLPGRYTISGLRRGLYYSPLRTPSYGDKVVLLPVGTNTIKLSTGLNNSIIYYKPVSYGQAIENVLSVPYKINSKWYYPYRAENFTAKASGSNIILNWTNKERNKPDNLLYSPVILEPITYKIEIYNYETNTLVRTVETTNSHPYYYTGTYTYSSADIATDGFTLSSNIKFVITRKALQIDYDHTIKNEVVYINSTNTIPAFYQTNSTNKLDYHINLDNFSTLTKQSEIGNYTFTYNNYNNKGFPNYKNGVHSISGVNFTANHAITASGLPDYGSYGQFTIAGWINVTALPTSGIMYIFKGNDSTSGAHIRVTTSGLTYFAGEGDGNTFYVPVNKWIFFAFSISWSTGKPMTYYVRDIDGYQRLKTHTITNSTVWYLQEVGPLMTFGGNTVDGAYTMQDFSVFNKSLYLLTNDWSMYDNMYNFSLQKIKENI